MHKLLKTKKAAVLAIILGLTAALFVVWLLYFRQSETLPGLLPDNATETSDSPAYIVRQPLGGSLPGPSPDSSPGPKPGPSSDSQSRPAWTVGPDAQPFEEALTPGFYEHGLQADFALGQTLQRLDLPPANLRLIGSEALEQGEIHYQYKEIEILAGPDLPLFISTLRNSLLAWTENALLAQQGEFDEKQQCGEWHIVLEGIVTHSLRIKAGTGQGVTPAEGVTASRLAIVVDDIGESMRQARQLLNLDYPVTFALWPYGTHAKKIAPLVKARGLDVLIHQPMEPVGYPGVNPGRGVLLSSMDDVHLLSQLDKNLRLIPEAIGLNNHMGSRLTQDARRMGVLARALKNRNLLVLDSLTHPRSRLAAAALNEGATVYRRDVFIDVEQNTAYVLAQLRKAEKIALIRGQAIAIGHPLPCTLEALQLWQKQRDPRVQLVRLSDLRPLEK